MKPSQSPIYALVIVEASVGRPLDYLVPPGLHIERGHVVQVRVRGRLTLAVVIALSHQPSVTLEPHLIKPIEALYDPKPLLAEYQFEMARWISQNYCSSMSRVLGLFIPKAIRKRTLPRPKYLISRGASRTSLAHFTAQIRSKRPAQARILDVMLKNKGAIALAELLERSQASNACIKALIKEKKLKLSEEVSFHQRNLNYDYIPARKKPPSPQQQAAIDAINGDIHTQCHSVHLLFGVTGSGKTEVFLQCMEAALKEGRRIIYLVPEIALTPQTTDRIRARLSRFKVALWHSGVSPSDKQTLWQQLNEGRIDILIGARSALLCPMDALGLIIIDEEHDSSFKSQTMPTYDSRELASLRAKLQHCPLILASATPSLETYHHALQGRYQLHKLSSRVGGGEMAEVQILPKPHPSQLIAPKLMDALSRAIEHGEQAILFLNRRGFFHYGFCTTCKKTIKCPHCDVNLTWHQSDRHWRCHICHLRSEIPPPCSTCKQAAQIRKCGCGTEQLEMVLRKRLQDARILRLDRDTGKSPEEVRNILNQFRTGKADILVGTQMVSKGHHFPMVSLCGIIDADSQLACGDYRCEELFMQQLIQLSGRAGRAFLKGQVFIQTAIEDGELINHLTEQDYERFAQERLKERERYLYPPYIHLIHFQISCENQEEAIKATHTIHHCLKVTLAQNYLLSDPSPSTRRILWNKHRYSILLKTTERSQAVHAIRHALRGVQLTQKVHLHIDVDPVNLD